MTTNENEIDTDQVSIYHATPLVAPGGRLAADVACMADTGRSGGQQPRHHGRCDNPVLRAAALLAARQHPGAHSAVHQVGAAR